MIEIIKHGNGYTRYRAICDNCGCEFTYTEADVGYNFNCPECGDYVMHESKNAIE